MICDKVVREDNGKIHLQGIYDRVIVNQIPAIHPEMYLFSRFTVELADRADGGNDVLRAELIHPDGSTEQLPTPKPKVASTGRVQIIVRLMRLPLRYLGQYLFRINFNEIEVGLIGFEVCGSSIVPEVRHDTRVQ